MAVSRQAGGHLSDPAALGGGRHGTGGPILAALSGGGGPKRPGGRKASAATGGHLIGPVAKWVAGK